MAQPAGQGEARSAVRGSEVQSMLGVHGWGMAPRVSEEKRADGTSSFRDAWLEAAILIRSLPSPVYLPGPVRRPSRFHADPEVGVPGAGGSHPESRVGRWAGATRPGYVQVPASPSWGACPARQQARSAPKRRPCICRPLRIGRRGVHRPSAGPESGVGACIMRTFQYPTGTIGRSIPPLPGPNRWPLTPGGSSCFVCRVSRSHSVEGDQRV